MFTKDLPTLSNTQMTAIEITINSIDDLIESATSFIKNGGQSYRSFLTDRDQLIQKIYTLPNTK